MKKLVIVKQLLYTALIISGTSLHGAKVINNSTHDVSLFDYLFYPPTTDECGEDYSHLDLAPGESIDLERLEGVCIVAQKKSYGVSNPDVEKPCFIHLQPYHTILYNGKNSSIIVTDETRMDHSLPEGAKNIPTPKLVTLAKYRKHYAKTNGTTTTHRWWSTCPGTMILH